MLPVPTGTWGRPGFFSIGKLGQWLSMPQFGTSHERKQIPPTTVLLMGNSLCSAPFENGIHSQAP